MKREEDAILCKMDTRIYGGFGGWTITRNGEGIYTPSSYLAWEKYPKLSKFERMARKDPDADWRAECFLALRDATYQRQGNNRWVLVRSGLGFA